MEERRGSRFDRLVRLVARGREPGAIGLVVIVPIVLLVRLVTVIRLVVWLALR